MSILSELMNELFQECSIFLKSLDEINSGNFEENFAILKEKFESLKNKKNHLNKSFDVSELKKFNTKLDKTIKQIDEKFDSILKTIKLEQKNISFKLKEEYNKKKLANYR